MSQKSQPPQILLVSDQSSSKEALEELIPETNLSNAELSQVSSEIFQQQTDLEKDADMIIIDDRLDAMSSFDMLRHCTERFPAKARLLLTRMSDRQRAVDAMKQGATDYLFKRDLSPALLSKAFNHCMDFTQQQAMLNRRNAVIDALFDQAEEAIFLSDENGALTLYNKVFVDLFQNGASAETDFNQFVQTYITEKPLYRYLSEEGPVSRLISLPTEDKGELSLRINLKRIRLSDRFERVLGMIADVTAEKRAEQEQLKTEKLEMTARMAQILAHEIRNPLTNIRLSADYLNEEYSDQEDVTSYSDIIERNVTRIDDLIQRMLQSVKPFEVKKEKVKLSDVMSILNEHIRDRQTLLEADVNISVEPKNLSWSIDAEKLELALLNLINNAFQAMMQIDHPKLDIQVVQEEDSLKILIRDNGKGMSEETQHNLFEAFYSQRKGGMGLGMTIVKNIVDAHGGKISVESVEGQGSTFIITTP